MEQFDAAFSARILCVLTMKSALNGVVSISTSVVHLIFTVESGVRLPDGEQPFVEGSESKEEVLWY